MSTTSLLPSPHTTYTAFADGRLLADGLAREVGVQVRRAMDRDQGLSVLIFDDRDGRQVDFDLRGSEQEIIARLDAMDTPEPFEPPRTPGRPRLGVTSREVTLLPRHWEWLSQQPGGASVTLRKLVEAARKKDVSQEVREAQQRADRFMMTTLGNQADYEEASRALYARDAARYAALSEPWPEALRDYARRLAAPAFEED